MGTSSQVDSFERDTTHRLLTEAVRHWVISHYLATGKVPSRQVWYAYPDGPAGFDWGNPPGPDDPAKQPLRRRRYQITVELEDLT